MQLYQLLQILLLNFDPWESPYVVSMEPIDEKSCVTRFPMEFPEFLRLRIRLFARIFSTHKFSRCWTEEGFWRILCLIWISFTFTIFLNEYALNFSIRRHPYSWEFFCINKRAYEWRWQKVTQPSTGPTLDPINPTRPESELVVGLVFSTWFFMGRVRVNPPTLKWPIFFDPYLKKETKNKR